ncbi:MAG: hypothetical protein K9M03_01805 [Kiritimatiellales bacterium]|nr:hypothetical protein [Kiritimatiellales bacterium]
MSHQTLRHRHFLLAPAFALLLVFTGLQGKQIGANVTSEIIDNNKGIRVLKLSDETNIMLFKEAEIENTDLDIHLVKGQALVSNRGYIRMEAGPYVLKSIVGGFHITVRDQVVTVAAISAPVLVQWEDQVVLVPVGLQWRGREKLASLNDGMDTWFKARKLKTVPTNFRREQLVNLNRIPKDSKNQSSKNTILFKEGLSMVLAPFQLPASRERAKKMNEAAFLEQVAEYVSEGDQEGVHALLMLIGVEDVIYSDSGITALAAMLTQASRYPLMSRDVMTSLSHDAHVWLLLGIHPDFRTTAWSMNRPDLTKEEYLVYLVTLPQADIMPVGFTEYVLARWQLDISDAAEEMDDPSSFLAQVFDLLIDQVESFRRHEYPQRAYVLTELISELFDLHSDLISKDQHDALVNLKLEEKVDVSLLETKEEVLPEDAVIVEAEEDVGLTPDEVKAKAYELMRSVGALFTVETVIEEISPTTASVRSILFSSANGEQEFEFDLNVISGEVFNIVQNGELSPFSLTLEAFAQWARK